MKVLAWLSARIFVMVGVVDSALIAGSGFLVNLLSGRYLHIEDYGLFVTLYTIASFSLIFQSSLISNPYMILSQSASGNEVNIYFLGTLVMTMVMGLLLGFLGAVCGLFYIPYSIKSFNLLGLFAAYIFLNLLQDFVRRYFYSKNAEVQAFLLDLISYGGQILVLFLVGKKLSLDILFLALGGTSGLALLIILAVNWKHFCLLPSCWNQLKNVIFKNWQFGRWMLFSNVISWMANQFYILALGMFQPAFVVAQLGVARTIAASSNPLILAYESMGMPRIARIWEVQGAQKTRAYVLMTALWGGGFFILTGSLFFMFPQQAIRFIFGKSFGDISILVKIFSILPFLWFVGKVFSLSILAMHRPKAVLPVYVMACCFTVTGGIWLTYQYGAIGAGIGFLVNGLVLTAGFIYQFLSQIEMAAMEKRHAFATIENAE